MSFNTILLEVSNGVATITLNRPNILNAINLEMQEELEEALAQARNLEVRALVLTGMGRGFCSGADVTGMTSTQESQEVQHSQDHLRRIRKPLGWQTLLLRDFPRPVIAAVNGVAAGAGLSLALGCDIRIAADSARFSAIFVRRGLVADYGCTYLLPRAVGMACALEMMYTGDIIDAREALNMGLVSRVVPGGDLMSAAQDLAQRIAQEPPITIELIKKVSYRGLENTLENQMLLEGEAGGIARNTEDYQEGVRSFLEGREPVFKGR